MLPTAKYRPLFAKIATEHLWSAALLEAQAMVESSGRPDAMRVEPGKVSPDDPEQHDASYGLLQVMGSTARKLGLVGPVEQLKDPLIGTRFGMLALVDIVRWRRFEVPWAQGAWKSVALPLPKEVQTILAVYNGGAHLNPGPDGTLRTQAYVDRVALYLEAVMQEVA